jgi:YVTN family beta-propeller protein
LEYAHRGRAIVVANRAGSLTLVDANRLSVRVELAVCDEITDMTALADDRIALLDPHRNELLVVAVGDRRVEVLQQLPIASTPVDVATSPDRKQLAIASLWSRRITLLEQTDDPDGGNWRVAKVIDMEFAPREQVWLSAKELVVFDGFGGALAVIDPRGGAIVREMPLEGHQVRAATVSRDGQSLLIPHQLLRADRATTHDGVHWGGVMSNVIRRLPIEDVRNPQTKRIGLVGLYYLGHPGKAFGDPHELVETSSGRRIVSFAGVAEIGVSDVGANYYRPVAVGRRPTALLLSRDEKSVLCANTFDDSLSVVDVETARETKRIELGPRRPLTMVEAGEQLFHDARLAVDGWVSCNSCHIDGHTNGLRNDNFSDDSFGSPKQIISLLGTAYSAPWSWDGGQDLLDHQIRASAVKTMRGEEPTREQVDQLSAFLVTLHAAPPIDLARGVVDQPTVARGRAVFERMECTECHRGPLLTTSDVFDVGLPDESGRRRFNPPSLRGVSQRDAYFHDGSGRSLDQVLSRHPDARCDELTDDERADLLAYLRSI